MATDLDRLARSAGEIRASAATDRPAAIAAARAFVAGNPDYVPGHQLLVDLLLDAGDRQGAIDAVGGLCELALTGGADGLIRRCLDAMSSLGALPANWSRLANLLRITGRTEGALEILDRRLAAVPDDLGARLVRCMAGLAVVHATEDEVVERRTAYALALADLRARVEQAGAAARAAGAAEVGMAKPFFLSYQGHDDTVLQRVYGEITHLLTAATADEPPPLAGPPEGRIRVGFATSYFGLHSVSKLFRGWIERLDRSRFEVFGYQFSRDEDPVQQAVSRAADHWRMGDISADKWVPVIAGDRLHVLVYLEIGMNTIAVQLANRRLAPVQAMSWGHPVTSGFPTVDWFLSSDLMEPPDGGRHYTERLVRLPRLSIFYRPLPSKGGRLTRTDLGLREDAVVYVCCQSLFKYLPRHDDLFVRIAARVPAAQFLFIGPPKGPATAVFAGRLTAAFTAAGLDPARHLAITAPVPPESFPSLLRAGDVYLDSVGWSGGNTTLEAVACDLPVVTLPTGLMRGRHSAAILTQMGMADAVCGSKEDYVALAVRLADASARAAMRARIAAGRDALYEDDGAVRALEAWMEDAVRAATGATGDGGMEGKR